MCRHNKCDHREAIRQFSLLSESSSGAAGAIYYVCVLLSHYNDVTIDAIASQITGLTVVYSTVYSDADQRKHQSSASLDFVREFTVDR